MNENEAASPENLFKLLSSSGLGDKKAFHHLYLLTSPKLFSVCIKLLGKTHLAEEALQEAFVNIWHHAQNYRPDKSAVMTWMTTIVRNKCFDILRRFPQETELLDLDFDHDFISTNHAPHELFSDKRELNALIACMKNLSPTQRQTIALSYFHGLTHEQLAKHLAQPLGSIKTWLRRGLISLKSCLSGVR
jgi:RNA polymerase sigma-70 factor, ECF subfamily